MFEAHAAVFFISMPAPAIDHFPSDVTSCYCMPVH